MRLTRSTRAAASAWVGAVVAGSGDAAAGGSGEASSSGIGRAPGSPSMIWASLSDEGAPPAGRPLAALPRSPAVVRAALTAAPRGDSDHGQAAGAARVRQSRRRDRCDSAKLDASRASGWRPVGLREHELRSEVAEREGGHGGSAGGRGEDHQRARSGGSTGRAARRPPPRARRPRLRWPHRTRRCQPHARRRQDRRAGGRAPACRWQAARALRGKASRRGSAIRQGRAKQRSCECRGTLPASGLVGHAGPLEGVGNDLHLRNRR